MRGLRGEPPSERAVIAADARHLKEDYEDGQQSQGPQRYPSQQRLEAA